MRRARWALLTLIALTGCSGTNDAENLCDGSQDECADEEPATQPVEPELPDVAQVQAINACGADRRCLPGSTTFAPDPELVDMVTDATARWSRASGNGAVQAADGGIPVRHVSGLVSADGNPACSLTGWIDFHGGPMAGRRVVQWIELDSNTPEFWIDGQLMRCPDEMHSLMHEIVHALAPHAAHAASGLFATRTEGNGLIDAQALAQLCSEADCLKFKPEEGTK